MVCVPPKYLKPYFQQKVQFQGRMKYNTLAWGEPFVLFRLPFHNIYYNFISLFKLSIIINKINLKLLLFLD